jgi:hypothetical protein
MAYFAVEGTGGLCWGLAFKRGWPHSLTLLAGLAGLSAALTVLSFLSLVLVLPLAEIARSYRQMYDTMLSAVGTASTYVGLGAVWRGELYPVVAPIGSFILANWWLLLIATSVAAAVPMVLTTYTLSNVLVRLMGHDVAPFPPGVIDRIGKRLARRLLRQSLRQGLIGRGSRT